MKCSLEITEEGLEDLKYFDKSAQSKILDEIEQQLVYQPMALAMQRLAKVSQKAWYSSAFLSDDFCP